MYGVMHPFSKAVYEVDETGAVLITTEGRPGRPLPARRLLARRRGVRRRPATVQLGRRRPRPAPPAERTEGELTMAAHPRTVPLRRQGRQGRLGQGVDRHRPPGRGPRLRQLPHGRPLRQPARRRAGADGRGRRDELASSSARTSPASTSATRCMFAKECATIDLLSEGRFTLGIGAGWSEKDYAIAGIHQDDALTRIDRLARGGADHEGPVGARARSPSTASTTGSPRSTPCPSRTRRSRS